jgi:tetratricopeptide (TPR) repeat protein
VVGCIDENLVLGFLAGALDSAGHAQVLDHSANCETCRDLLRESELALAPETSGILETVTAGGGLLAPLRIGDRVQRYTIEAFLGSGAMGSVYRAHDPELDRHVALKVLAREGGEAVTGDSDSLLREARAAARVVHPNVVSVFDAGTDAGRVFIAMELVEGVTLAARIREAELSWRGLLDLFVQAGRGLEAAHRAGVVHRDFKPENVFAASDGRVKVGDFGLARWAPPTPGGQPRGAPGERTASALAGTPAYMAPECWEHAATPGSDQFSFCVALYEALYGVHPFRADPAAPSGFDFGALQKPRMRRGSSRISRALLRGLSRAPEQRFRSMSALLEALDPARSSARTRIAIGVGLVATIAIVAGVASRTRGPGAGATRCVAADAPIASAWNDGSRARLRSAFAATQLPFAETTWTKTEARLEAYANAWSHARRDACDATFVRAEQSEAVLARSNACLDRALEQLRASLEALAAPDRTTVERSVALASALPDVTSCDAAHVVKSAPEVVLEPAKRAARDETRRVNDLARAHATAGRQSAALEMAERAVASEGGRYDPALAADALVVLGKMQYRTGNVAGSESSLTRATTIAEEGAADRTKASALTELAYVRCKFRGDVEGGLRFASLAEASLARAGGDELTSALLAERRGACFMRAGRFDEAVAASDVSVPLHERRFGPNDPHLLAALNGSLIPRSARGDLEEATRGFERVLTLGTEALGPLHPNLAVTRVNLAETLRKRRLYPEALGHARAAVALLRQVDTRPDGGTANAEGELGICLSDAGAHDEALVQLGHAFELTKQVFGSESPRLAEAEVSLARARLRVGKRTEALAAASSAVARLRSLGDGRDRTLHILALTVLGDSEEASLRNESAATTLAEASTLAEQQPLPAVDRATLEFAHARALLATRGDRATARALAEKARERFETLGHGRADVERIDLWLARAR